MASLPNPYKLSNLGDVWRTTIWAFPPLNTSIFGKDSQIKFIFHLNISVFQTNGKQPYSFPVLSRFCNCLPIGNLNENLCILSDFN